MRVSMALDKVVPVTSDLWMDFYVSIISKSYLQLNYFIADPVHMFIVSS